MALDNPTFQTQIEAGGRRWGMAGPDTKNNETPYPIWGFDPPSPEPDTKKLDALLASLNGSAERFQTLWFSFLGLTLYLAIAALATTHRNLLLGEPQVLPILNIKVELLPFYVIAPLLYLVFHFYLLMMLLLLARTAAEFDKQLRTTLPGEPERERYRAQVGNALFLQLLVGMKGERSGVNAFLLGLIALITIVLAPLATLVLMQMMFLPYHHFRITWWHRGIVVVDLILIVVMTYRCFFPRGVRKAPLVLGALNRKPRWATAMAFCALLAVVLAPLVDWLSFQQGRWAGEPRASSFREWASWMGGEPSRPPYINSDYSPTAKGVVFGLFPDRLILPFETLVDDAQFQQFEKENAAQSPMRLFMFGAVPTRDFRGRNLQAANLAGADLRGVALVGANLGGAQLEYARLHEANMQAAQLQNAELEGAQLLGARLGGADLKGADLHAVLLTGADLTFAMLRYARLIGAELQGATLAGSELQGAWLGNSHMEGANLSGAQMEAADLSGAQMEGANLVRAKLKGSAMQQTHLQGAFLNQADLEGANLINADLGGANLTMANLHGAQLKNAQLQGADLAGANGSKASLTTLLSIAQTSTILVF
jgi:uncharacterized protein YjbI with pentapeptide repeats